MVLCDSVFHWTGSDLYGYVGVKNTSMMREVIASVYPLMYFVKERKGSTFLSKEEMIEDLILKVWKCIADITPVKQMFCTNSIDIIFQIINSSEVV